MLFQPNNVRKPIEELLLAEESDDFNYEAPSGSTLQTTRNDHDNELDEDEYEFQEAEEDKYAAKQPKSQNSGIADLAKKIQEAKLNSPPLKEVRSHVNEVDLDVDVDELDLENVDTTDVNLDDDDLEDQMILK